VVPGVEKQGRENPMRKSAGVGTFKDILEAAACISNMAKGLPKASFAGHCRGVKLDFDYRFGYPL
jgi:hypothetical protein